MADVEIKGDAAELADVRKALKAPDWYDLTAWAELVVLKREQAEARVAELEAERDELRAFNSKLHERLTGRPSENEAHLAAAVHDTIARAEQAEAERDELRTKVTDAAVIAVAFDHEFRAIAKALGLGSSATAGEIAETVGAVIAERDAFKRDAANLLEALENRPEPWETREADHAHGEAQARVRKLEAARLWVMEGLRSSEVRAGEPTDAEMEAAGAVDKRLLTAGEVNDLCRQAEGLRDRVAEIEAERRWVPVTERMPTLGEDVLVWSPGWTAATQGYRTTRDVFVSMDEVDMPSATHWRSIPTGPAVQPAPAPAPAPIPTPTPAPPKRVWQVVGYMKEPMHGEGRTAREAVMWALDEYGIEEEVMEEATFGPMRFEARPWLDDETLGDAEVVTLEAHASEPVVRWAPAREPQP